MKLLSFLAKSSPRSLWITVIAGILSGVSNAGLLAIFNAALKDGGRVRPALILAFVALCLFLPLTRFTSEVVLTRLSQGALYALRLRLSRQILAAPLSRLEEVGAPRLLAALNDDIPTITNALMLIPIVAVNAAVTIAALVYLGWLSEVVLLAVLGFMALGILTYQLPVIKALRSLRLAREDEDSLFQHFRDLTAGAKELKLHRRRREAFLRDVLQKTAGSFRDHSIAGNTVYSAASSWGQVLVFVVIGLIVFVLPRLQPVEVMTLTGYTISLLYLMTPLQVIMNSLPAVGRANVALNKIEELGLSLESQGTERDSDREPEPHPSWGCLALKAVTHGYRCAGERDDFVLGPIDMTLVPGEVVFLVGGNGSGKTTLAKLVTGLYAPESGEIVLNGETITDESRECYRQHFSMVFSDFHLFESLLGLDSEKLDARAAEYLLRLQLDQKVQVREGVLSTTELSQGQRKRLALLTAYLEDRPIYVFDEWAADQDPVFKEVFYCQLLPELKLKGKSVLVISHDDRYYDLADRIIKLDYGKIVSSEIPAAPHVVAGAQDRSNFANNKRQ